MFALQLQFIQYLHKARGPFLDNLIKLFDFFDRQEFLFILIPVIWLGLGWRFGMKVFYLMALSHVVNLTLKNVFALPRPFHLDPSLGIIQVGSYGFPSGAAQSAILLSGLLLIYWKSSWRWVVAATYMILLSFSRVYLGVHFPMDILGGWIVGFLLLGVYFLVFPKVEQFFERRSPLNALLINYVLLLPVLIWQPTKTIYSICACAIGLGMGVFIYRNNPVPNTKLEFWTRILIGISGIFLINSLKVFQLQPFIVFVGIGIWMSFGAPYICDKLSAQWAKNAHIE